jgi:hypothetical protein
MLREEAAIRSFDPPTGARPVRDDSTAEHRRLAESRARQADWKRWGPYVSDRAWGTVREDYGPDGDAWNYVPHDHARSRAYRWNEDGLAGFCDRRQVLCLAVALWNGCDPILKERYFGLTNAEGNHGEDVKEYYFHLDGTPTHSYMRMVYKYPQSEYPYARLVEESASRGRAAGEFELFDVLGDELHAGRYFDVFVEYAKAGPEDILCRVTAINRGRELAPLHVLPHLWYRNTWSWGDDRERPELVALDDATVLARGSQLGERWWHVDASRTLPELLFTENDTNAKRLSGVANPGPYVKDGFHEAVVDGRPGTVNPARRGSKAAAHYRMTLAPGEPFTVRHRFADTPMDRPFDDFDEVFERRRMEADAFYNAIQGPGLDEDERHVQRSAFAGLMWSKQFYHYDVDRWLKGDQAASPPPPSPQRERNEDWKHLFNHDVVSVPDKWEYPWYASWDLAFHCIPIARIDPEWARRQVLLLLREWYMHPNGQIPAYEWSLSDANPPIHARAARRVYQISRDVEGRSDVDFLEEVFHKLLLNFNWWVNRKDREGRNIFQGGFLGLDNIGIFDRSTPPLPDGSHLEQADATAWMALYSLDMLAIALELSLVRPAYEGIATKFFEHFIAIANGINGIPGLWDREDGFFYDLMRYPGESGTFLKLRSLVGLIPLLAVDVITEDVLERLPKFRRRMDWFLEYRFTHAGNASLLTEPGAGGSRLLTIVDREKLEALLARLLDEAQFLSDFGLRSLSREYADAPFRFDHLGLSYSVAYEPAEATGGMLGGNSNWRGPIWFPINYLVVEALRVYHLYYRDTLTVELPRGSGRRANLSQVADELSSRLTSIFLRDRSRGGRRPVLGEDSFVHHDEHWRDYVPFHEYFHGDSGEGLGASHQTGWTALVVELMGRGRRAGDGPPP